MKKIFIVSLLFALACASSSYKDNDTDKQLVKNLVGTWEGSIYVDDEEIPVDYQFFESTDGLTGNFVEIAYLHEYDGDFDIRYFAYTCGECSVKDGRLSLTFIPESAYADIYDQETFEAYVSALWEFYHEEGREILWEDESELAISVLETFEDVWAQFSEDRNQAGASFGNLTVTDDKMSFVSGESTWEFTHSEHEWFTGYPYSE